MYNKSSEPENQIHNPTKDSTRENTADDEKFPTDSANNSVIPPISAKKFCGSGFCGSAPSIGIKRLWRFDRLRRETMWHLAHGERIGLAVCAGCRRFFGPRQETLELADANAVHITDDYRCLTAWASNGAPTPGLAARKPPAKPPKREVFRHFPDARADRCPRAERRALMNDVFVATRAPRTKPPPRLERVAFKTSRLLDFVGERELTAQIGRAPAEWPLVIAKELIDNALDACEEVEVTPSLSISVDTTAGTIRIADNGTGIAAGKITDIIDYTVRVSSREAYVTPTRGAQGNALKTLLAMGFALSGERGETLIESRGVAHRIVFAVDRIRQEPRIEPTKGPSL
jgi:hypothetical protein